MSVLIKNMHVPKSCSKCRFYVDDYGADFCAAVKRHTRDIPIIGKLPDCPLEDVPLLPNHGKLIDADAVEKRLQKYWYEEYPNQEASYHRAFMDSNACVKDLPTIIEAEVSE